MAPPDTEEIEILSHEVVLNTHSHIEFDRTGRWENKTFVSWGRI